MKFSLVRSIIKHREIDFGSLFVLSNMKLMRMIVGNDRVSNFKLNVLNIVMAGTNLSN